MNVEVITSFNQKYYDLIGYKSVETWLQYWPQEMTLTCYVEQMTLPDHPRIKQIGFDELGQDYLDFQNDAGIKQRPKTFAKKGYCTIHAMNNSQADWILWLDADVVSLQTVTPGLLKTIMPDRCLATYMGVEYTSRKSGLAGHWLVPETGIFAVNKKHKKFDKLRQEYYRIYQQKDFKDLRRMYDNDVFGSALSKINAECYDLCKELDKSYKTPMKHTILGPYLQHYKAKHNKQFFSQNNQ